MPSVVRFAILAALGLGLAGPARAVDAPPPAPAPAPAPDYHPSLGDLMTMAVQPRHTKVGLAGRDRNWAYLTYESSELRNAFGRIGRTIPTYRQTKLSDLFASAIVPAIDELDAAIKAKDGARFDAAYANLTASCNACHAAMDHAAVAIRAPTGAPYPDQDFQAR
jgi:cytochrome c553